MEEAPAEGAAAASRSRCRRRWRAVAWHGLAHHRAREALHAFLSLDTATEACVRHSYDAVTGVWSTTRTRCKLEATPFAEGAMRCCYRLLKETEAPNVSLSYAADFHHASSYGEHAAALR
jgi:hypothetical protein